MEEFTLLDSTLMRRFSVFFTCCLDDNTMNYVLSLFNFSMLLLIQVLMFAIKASIEDEILAHLSRGFKVIYTCVSSYNNFTNWLDIHTVNNWS